MVNRGSMPPDENLRRGGIQVPPGWRIIRWYRRNGKNLPVLARI